MRHLASRHCAAISGEQMLTCVTQRARHSMTRVVRHDIRNHKAFGHAQGDRASCSHCLRSRGWLWPRSKSPGGLVQPRPGVIVVILAQAPWSHVGPSSWQVASAGGTDAVVDHDSQGSCHRESFWPIRLMCSTACHRLRIEIEGE
jgi:hypothetical protein